MYVCQRRYIVKVIKDDDFNDLNANITDGYKKRPLQQNSKIKSMPLKSAEKIGWMVRFLKK